MSGKRDAMIRIYDENDISSKRMSTKAVAKSFNKGSGGHVAVTQIHLGKTVR
jgi:hypothetical protein